MIQPRLIIQLISRNRFTTSQFKSIHLMTDTRRRPSAAALIIGDEILTGKTLDRNGHFLAQKCFDVGLNMKTLCTIPDCESTIMEHVRRLSSQFDYVFTSGGIGPTHDDITYPSIAKAFDLPLVLHQPTLDRMTQHFSAKQPPVPITEARKRMALLPSIQPPISRVHFTENEDPESRPSTPLWVPLVIVHNVHILPGIPSLFQHIITHYFKQVIHPQLSQLNHVRRVRRLFGTELGEGDLAEQLTMVQKRFDGRVQLGSYPNWRLVTPKSTTDVVEEGENKLLDKRIKVVISMEGDAKGDVDDCAELLAGVLPVVELNEDRTIKAHQ